jgi:hypothetical protein
MMNNEPFPWMGSKAEMMAGWRRDKEGVSFFSDCEDEWIRDMVRRC